MSASAPAGVIDDDDEEDEDEEEDEEDDDDDDEDIYFYNGIDIVPKHVCYVVVHSSVTEIPEEAFRGCKHLVVVELPDGLQVIRNSAFRRCMKLRRINIPSSVKEIGQFAFGECMSLETIILPDGLEDLGASAFTECGLETITIPPLIRTIEKGLCRECMELTNVDLPSELLEIKQDAFYRCRKLVKLTLPSSLKVIGKRAFMLVGDDMPTLDLPESVELIEANSFNGVCFPQFRVPPLMTKVDFGIFNSLHCIVSIELSEVVEQVSSDQHMGYRDDHMIHYDLRNIAFPAGCTVDANIVERLNSFYIRGEGLLHELQHRFDGLPMHKICYYHSFCDTASVIEDLKREISLTNETSKHQDFVGMTPLHILACSTKQDLEIYQLLVGHRPEYLITKDQWYDIPLVYAFWCNAPDEVIQFLVEGYKTHYPQFDFEWGDMMYAIANTGVSNIPLQKLLDTQQRYFPDHTLDMEAVILRLAESCKERVNPDTFRSLVESNIGNRLASLNNSSFQAELTFGMLSLPPPPSCKKRTRALYAKLNSFETIKEAVSLLELALWKSKMEDHHPKKARFDNENNYRTQCRVDCGAEIIIRNVLPFLWEQKVYESFSDLLMASREFDDAGVDSDDDDDDDRIDFSFFDLLNRPS